jgi:hypothetical protein
MASPIRITALNVSRSSSRKVVKSFFIVVRCDLLVSEYHYTIAEVHELFKSSFKVIRLGRFIHITTVTIGEFVGL